MPNLLSTNLVSVDMTAKETCSNCGHVFSFPRSVHIDSPLRNEGGGMYVEGGGQICGSCKRRVYKTVLPEYIDIV